jgi:tagatose-1,6-bisphosphate aldolase
MTSNDQGATARSGLAAIATADDTFAIVAIDQRNTLARMYASLGNPDPTLEERTHLKADVVQTLRGTPSAFLLDSTFGVPALAELPEDGPAFGLLIAAEPSERGSINGEPRTFRDPAMGARWVRRQGGDALKYLIQLRADRPVDGAGVDTAAEVIAIVRQLVAECREAGIPSVIENIVYPLAGEQPPTPAQRADRIVEAAIVLNDLGPDLIKLEYPGDAASCRRLADALTVPWAVLSAGVAFGEFADAVRVACDEGGASGFIAGRSLWKETVGMDRASRRTFLADQGRRRLDDLVAVIDGRARPFTAVAGAS